MDMTFPDDTPVYVISVAAQLSGLHPQTLRTYDRMGLVSPGRTSGRGRRYSMRDIVMLREIQRLSQEEGINLAGIKHILELQHETVQLREELIRLHALIDELGNELESTRSVAARLAQLRNVPAQGGTDLVPIRQTSVVLWRQQHNNNDQP
jgi:MerR family transcriptional regulator/heat shock protein HspR